MAHIILPISIVYGTVAPVKDTLTLLLVIYPLTIVVGTTGEGVTAFARAHILEPLSVVFIAVEVVHHTVTVLIVTEPQTIVAVVVGEIVDPLAVLLILEPLAFVLLAVDEGISAEALTLTFIVFAFVDITIFVRGTPLAMRLARL